ncbi:MAG: hypothetical protein IIX63_05070 [Treponema sp.]|nr:hypothetical protein [Treponema sp.]MBQ1971021.1 hypothetical protein [Treponema sp.]MBQ5646508.1 hypothetical protein [Treponema sp.]
MENVNTRIIEVLNEQNSILDVVLTKQQELRNSVNEKNWTNLMTVISEINLSMDKFNKLDEEREEITTAEDVANSEYKRILSIVRGKLVKSRTENKVLSEYINITKGFVQSIIDNALPQSRNKLYSRNGNIIQSQPQSVVVNTLF